MKTIILIILLFNIAILPRQELSIRISLNEDEIKLLLKEAVSKNDIKTFQKFINELLNTSPGIKQRLINSEEILKNLLSFTDSAFHSKNLKSFYIPYSKLTKLFSSNAEFIESIEENFSSNFRKNISYSLISLNNLDVDFFEKQILPSILFIEGNIIQIKEHLDNKKFHNRKIYKILMREYERYTHKKNQ